ncbi:Lipoprotein OS=Afipia felis OX=1035 GN=BN961_03589 PE=4 SV=1 [Afipia felis]
MALIGRLFSIFFGFLAACFVAGAVVMFALVFPEMDVQTLDIDSGAMNVMLGIGFVLISGFALLPALIAVLVTEAFSIRHILIYAIFGGLAGLGCYLAFIPFDTETMTFVGVVRRHVEVMVGAGILGGVVYWLIAGRNAGAWREPIA